MTYFIEKGSGLNTKFEVYVNREVKNPYDLKIGARTELWAREDLKGFAFFVFPFIIKAVRFMFQERSPYGIDLERRCDMPQPVPFFVCPEHGTAKNGHGVFVPAGQELASVLRRVHRADGAEALVRCVRITCDRCKEVVHCGTASVELEVCFRHGETAFGLLERKFQDSRVSEILLRHKPCRECGPKNVPRWTSPPRYEKVWIVGHRNFPHQRRVKIPPSFFKSRLSMVRGELGCIF